MLTNILMDATIVVVVVLLLSVIAKPFLNFAEFDETDEKK